MASGIVKKVIAFQFLVSLCLGWSGREGASSAPRGPYLGQNPPGEVPELFAPGLVSRPGFFEHSAAVFTPDGTEVYWSAKPNGRRYFQVYFMKMKDGAWSLPALAPFCSPDRSCESFAMTPDGRRIYLNNGREMGWIERQGEGWSELRPLPPQIDSDAYEYVWSVTRDGSVYFTKFPELDIWVSRSMKGEAAPAEKLGPAINSGDTRESSVFVDPEGRFLILEASKDGVACELFVCHRRPDGSWSERARLPIDWGRFPSISPDGMYLFFMTRDGIYWVSAKIIMEEGKGVGPQR